MQWHYDKTEKKEELLDPSFWIQFDYVLAARPERVIGKWEIVHTVYGYAGLEILRPGDGQVDSPLWQQVESKGYGEKTEEGANGTTLQVLFAEAERLGMYGLVREGFRRWLTQGWWIGPRMEAKVHILKRIP